MKDYFEQAEKLLKLYEKLVILKYGRIPDKSEIPENSDHEDFRNRHNLKEEIKFFKITTISKPNLSRE